MQIDAFIQHITRHTCGEPRVWCIASPPNFGITYAVTHNLAAFGAQSCVRVDIQETPVEHIAAQVAMPFLGQRCVYFIESVYAADKKTQKRLLQVLTQHRLEHHVILFSDQETVLQEHVKQSSKSTYVELNDIRPATFVKLYKAMFAQSFPQAYVSHVFHKYGTIAFEHAYLAMWYYYVLGKNFTKWTEQWLSRIVAPQMSLFQLSHVFFQKNSVKLLLTWHEMASMYPAEFWIAFWGEQLWQAYMFITIAQTHTVSRARKSCSKLPFAFMDMYWRTISKRHIVQALTHLYMLDVRIKSGTADTRLFELFFSQWLTDSFTQETLWGDDAARNNDCHRFLAR